MQVAVELREGASYGAPAEQLATRVFEKLAALNGDFLNAWKRTATLDNMPALTIHAFNTGPFEGGQQRLKNTYVATATVYDKL